MILWRMPILRAHAPMLLALGDFCSVTPYSNCRRANKNGFRLSSTVETTPLILLTATAGIPSLRVLCSYPPLAFKSRAATRRGDPSQGPWAYLPGLILTVPSTFL